MRANSETTQVREYYSIILQLVFKQCSVDEKVETLHKIVEEKYLSSLFELFAEFFLLL